VTSKNLTAEVGLLYLPNRVPAPRELKAVLETADPAEQ
jgi:hypothetical protein